MAMLILLKKSKDYSGLNVHGMGSTFRDQSEVSSYPRELAEAAYQRGDPPVRDATLK
jgi:hypothetical protein